MGGGRKTGQTQQRKRNTMQAQGLRSRLRKQAEWQAELGGPGNGEQEEDTVGQGGEHSTKYSAYEGERGRPERVKGCRMERRIQKTCRSGGIIPEQWGLDGR